MAGYETGNMENDPAAIVCEHGQLKRTCEICAEWKPRALEAEARVKALEAVLTGRVSHRYMGGCPDSLQPDSRDPGCPACRVLGV